MASSSDDLKTTLITYAQVSGLSAFQVISIKFRPVGSGTNSTDPFGRQDSGKYQYPSEYAAGARASTLPLIPASGTIYKAIKPTLGNLSSALLPGNTPSFFQGGPPDVFWIPREGGLGIIGALKAIAASVGFVSNLIKIYDAIRQQIVRNVQDPNSDRFWKDVNDVRVEVRWIAANGRFWQILVYTGPINSPFNPAIAVALDTFFQNLPALIQNPPLALTDPNFAGVPITMSFS